MTPLTPLESFRAEMLFHPWYFWQLNAPGSTVVANCDQNVTEFSYQATTDAVGRADVRRALETSEQLVRTHLGYSPAPHVVDTVLPFPRYFDTRLNRNSFVGADGRWLTVQLPEAKIRAIGIEKFTLLGTVSTAGPSPDLVFSDEDADGIDDTFTATIATTVTDPDEIRAMFAAADRFNADPLAAWEIAPIGVSLAGGIATITGRYWQLVKPILYQSPLAGSALSIAQTSHFVDSLDIYRRQIDASGTTRDTAQAVLIWETRPFPYFSTCIGCGSSSIPDNAGDPAAQAYALARAVIRDGERGIVGVGEAVWDATAAQWQAVTIGYCRPPDRVQIRYEAGAPRVNGEMDHTWLTVVSRLAAAEIGKRLCACNTANKELYYWQIDHAFDGSAELEKFVLTDNDMINPLGTRKGQLYAWKQIQANAFRRGVLGV